MNLMSSEIWKGGTFLHPSRIYACEHIIKKIYLKIELDIDSFGYIAVIMSILIYICKKFFSADAGNNKGQCFKLIQTYDSDYSLYEPVYPAFSLTWK